MKKFTLIICSLLGCILSLAAQTKFAGIVVNQQFGNLVAELNSKYSLLEPDYKTCQAKGFDTNVLHRYRIDFLGDEDAELYAFPNLDNKDIVDRLEIRPSYLCNTKLKDAECERSIKEYAAYLKNIYEGKYGKAVEEITADEYKKITHHKWDLGDVILDIVLIEPKTNTFNVLNIPMRVNIEYQVKKDRIKTITTDDI